MWRGSIFLSVFAHLYFVAFARVDLSIHNHIKKLGVAHLEQTHTIVIAVKQRNLDNLDKAFEEVTNPKSNKFRKYYSRYELADMTSNMDSKNFVVNYLADRGITAKTSRFGDYITLESTVRILNNLLETQFHEYEVTVLRSSKKEKENIIRAVDFKIPTILADHVATVLNVDEIPPPVMWQPDFHLIENEELSTESSSELNDITNDNVQSQKYDISRLAATTQYVTPPLLKSFYHIEPQLNVSALGSQCVYSTIDQNFSPSNLRKFQTFYGLPPNPVSSVIGGHNSDSMCISNPNNCIEANLDVQYIMSSATNVSTMHSYDADTTNFIVNWIVSITNMVNPPLVISISYGILELYLSTSFIKQFEIQAKILALQGVTLIAASGDDGAPGYNVGTNSKNCGYYPMWPASSPYVLSVGATQGPESSSSESACMAKTGGRITTGGGFSTLSSRPVWQTAAVENYLKTVTVSPYVGTTKNSAPSLQGRGYPDISLLGFNYRVYIGKSWYAVSGTSASAPVFAGMLALVNSKRISLGWPSLGHFNLELYANATHFVQDVNSGDNLCVAAGSSGAPVCCAHGFYSSEGWDPVTGFGSVDFRLLYSYFTSAQQSDGSLPGSTNSASSRWGTSIGKVVAMVTSLCLGTIFALLTLC